MTRCNLLVPFVIAAGLCLAQQPGTPQPAAPGGGAANAVTGCLSKGSSPGEYELTNEKGEKVKLISSEDLSKHVSHKVRVTGSAGKEQDKTVLRVEGVEHVADSCS